MNQTPVKKDIPAVSGSPLTMNVTNFKATAIFSNKLPVLKREGSREDVRFKERMKKMQDEYLGKKIALTRQNESEN